MVPTWLLTLLVVIAGCIFALYIGSNLSEMDPWTAGELVLFVVACTVCAASNNFPLLYALGSWLPVFPHLGFNALPAITWFFAWMGGVLFLRLCVKGYLNYAQSFDWFCLIPFFWVPIRYMMHPATQLGSTSGGSGVSGLAPYFGYMLVPVYLVITGALLPTRTKLVSFLRWCFVVVLFGGTFLLICAFIPATAPFLGAMGMFSAGDISDNVQRIVVLPGYGLQLTICALCPTLYRLRNWQAPLVFILGIAMILVGGNRSALSAVFFAVPIALLVQRKTHALAVAVLLGVFCIGGLNAVTASVDNPHFSGFLRAFGVFDTAIEETTGGSASAEWRYKVWRDGMKKIMEAPLTGKGFGGISQHPEGRPDPQSTDYEDILAGGMAHNGFIDAAYGLGIPFALALTVIMFVYLYKEVVLGLATDRHDFELREMHAYFAAVIGYMPVCIYTAFDLSVGGLWVTIALSCALSHFPRSASQTTNVADASPSRYGWDPASAKAQSYRQY